MEKVGAVGISCVILSLISSKSCIFAPDYG